MNKDFGIFHIIISQFENFSMNKIIEGIKISPLKIISDNRGSVMHMQETIAKFLKSLVRFTFQQSLKKKLKPGTYIKRLL